MKPIVVVGSINMDLVSRTERMPVAGETIFGSNFQTHTGGKGANQAVAVARLGHRSILLGKVGDDIFGRELRDTLSAYGVDMSEVETIPGSSGTASIVVDSKGENCIIVVPGANLHVTPEYLQSKIHVLRQAGMVLVQLEVPLETVAYLAQICEELNVPLMLDPAPAQPLDANTLARIDWFTPNQTEAQFYADGDDTSDRMLQKFFRFGVKNIILKKGAEGSLIALQDGAKHRINSVAVDAVDTTAAGDAFNGAYAIALMRGYDAKACGDYALPLRRRSRSHAKVRSLPSQMLRKSSSF